MRAPLYTASEAPEKPLPGFSEHPSNPWSRVAQTVISYRSTLSFCSFASPEVNYLLATLPCSPQCF